MWIKFNTFFKFNNLTQENVSKLVQIYYLLSLLFTTFVNIVYFRRCLFSKLKIIKYYLIQKIELLLLFRYLIV